MELYSDRNPETTIKGFGYKNKDKAIFTLKKLKKIKASKKYSFQVVNTMYNRAKYHKYRTKDMEKAMKVFNKFLKAYKSKKSIKFKKSKTKTKKKKSKN